MNISVENNEKKLVFSGIQPTGIFTLGNLLGAIKNWKRLENQYKCIFSVVDMHSITLYQDPKQIKENIISSLALLLACGLDPKNSTIFVQSHVDAHAKLNWVLSCYTQFGELSRMTQFKDKSQNNSDNINAGLFTYPVLMASDILLYDTDYVPVGEDQKQHMELARNVANRFNGLYGNTFKLPEPVINKVGSRIMSLQNPSTKMSKSDKNKNAFISVLDSKDEIIKKFKKSVTDSDNKIIFSKEKPGISNLISIYSAITDKSIKETEDIFKDKTYGEFKMAVANVVVDYLEPIQHEYKKIVNEKDYIKKVIIDGAVKANEIAEKTINNVYNKIGFIV